MIVNSFFNFKLLKFVFGPTRLIELSNKIVIGEVVQIYLKEGFKVNLKIKSRINVAL